MIDTLKETIKLIEEMSDDLDSWMQSFGTEISEYDQRITRDLMERAGMILQKLKG